MLLELLVYTVFSLALLGLLFLFLGYYIRHAQDLLLYHPDQPEGSTVSCDAPQAWEISNGERAEIVTADGVTLAGYYMKAPRSAPTTSATAAAATTAAETTPQAAAAAIVPPTLVYFHGNAGNVGHRLPIAKYFLEGAGNPAHRCDVLMMDYRGYGLSDAVRPCEVGLQLDASAVMEWISKQAVPGSKLIVMGVSLGGAVALYLASHRKYRGMISGLILENTFCGISEMADSLFGNMIENRFPHWGGTVLSFVLRRLLKPLIIQIHWRSIDRIGQVSCPILFLSGLSDELVPPSQMRQLFEGAIRAPLKRFVAFEGGHHNDLCNKDGFFEHVGRFVLKIATSY